jgi:hypothetical protein
MSLGAYGIVSVPVGDFSDGAGTGFGGGARYQYGFDFESAFTASAGYISWTEKDFVNSSFMASAWEILIGGKYYFTTGLFGQLEAGVDFFSTEVTTGGGLTVKDTETRFMFPIGLGYQHEGVELTAKYYIYHPDATSFGFTLGYNFALE